MSKPEPGPNQHAADRVARKSLELGLSPAKAKLMVRHATHGEDGCFNTTVELSQAEDIRRPDGRPYHPEHLGRCNRQLAAAGLIDHTRIAPGVKPNKRANRGTSHGTTLNVVNWSALFGKRRPALRNERRKAAAEHRRKRKRERELAGLAGASCNEPPRRHAAFVPFVPPPGLVEHAQRTGRELDQAEMPGRDGGADLPSVEEILANIERARAAMESPESGATGPPE